MINCTVCKKTTKKGVPTGNLIIWSYIKVKGEIKGSRIINQRKACMKCSREILFK